MDSKTKLLIIILCLVLFAMGFGAGYITYYAIESNRLPLDDRAAYKALDGSYDVQAYEDFLADYPDSPRADNVRERKEKLECMFAEWAQIQAIGNIGDFLNFKANYSNPRYNRLCDLKIDSLEYVNARTANTLQSYRAYLRKYPEGRFADAANEALKSAAAGPYSGNGANSSVSSEATGGEGAATSADGATPAGEGAPAAPVAPVAPAASAPAPAN